MSYQNKNYNIPNKNDNINNLVELVESIKDMETVEKELIEKNEMNNQKLNNYIHLLEEIIEEYHILTMKIYNC